jgi:ribosomal protein L16 Arg81 hydroxylase
MFNLEQILSPYIVEDFIQQNWGKKAIHIPGPREKFAGLFGWSDIEKILNFSRPSYENIHLLYEKNALPIIEIKKIGQWLHKGATLLVNFVNQIDERWDRLAASLGKDLNTIISINCYASCPSKQGFDLHFDKHDVFVVQAKGRKKWFVYEPTSVKYPMEKQTLSMKQDLPKAQPYLECELAEGDVLYIPRGHWHYAVAVTPSIHLSVGSEARTGVDFLNWMTTQLMDYDEFFRKDFPLVQSRALGGSREDSALEKHLAEFCRRMAGLFKPEEMMPSLVRFCMQNNPVRRRYQMPSMWEIKEKISPQTFFILNPAQKILYHFDENKRTAMMQLRGYFLTFKEMPQDFLEYLFSHDEAFCGEVILAALPAMNWERLKPVLIELYEREIIQLDDSAVSQFEKTEMII